MEIIFQPSWILTLVLIVVPLVAIFSIWLKQGKNQIKIISTVVVVIITGLIAFLLIRPTRIRVDQQGLYTDVYFEHHFSWDQVNEVIYITNLETSDYEPDFRQNGMAFGNERKGYFSLKNGQNAFIMTETNDKALCFSVDEAIYLFAPKEFDRFFKAVSKYVRVKE